MKKITFLDNTNVFPDSGYVSGAVLFAIRNSYILLCETCSEMQTHKSVLTSCCIPVICDGIA